MNIAARLLLASLAASSLARAQPALDAPAAEAAPAPTLRLADLSARVRSSHPALLAARARVRAARSAAVGAGLWTNPILDASYTAALRRSSYDPAGAPVVGVTQFLELSGAPRARRRAADLEADAASLDVSSIERALLVDLSRAFFDYAEATEQRKAHDEHLRELLRVESLIKARVDGGLAPRYEATRVALALADARAAAASAQASLHRARAALSAAAGEPVPEGALVDIDLDTAPDVPALTAAQAEAEAHPALAAARRRAEAAAASVDAARRGAWPGLGLRLGGGFGQAPGQVDLSLGLVIPLPLLDRGQAAVAAGEARSDEARAEAAALTRAVRGQLQAAHAELARRAAALAAFRSEARALLGPLREQAEAGYRDGRLSAFELIEASQSARDARLRQIELAAAAHAARAALRRIAG